MRRAVEHKTSFHDMIGQSSQVIFCMSAQEIAEIPSLHKDIDHIDYLT